jgi:transposase
MRPKGSPETREALRRLAVERVLDGYDVPEVAAFVGVAPFSVRRWVAAYERDGERGLTAVPPSGRPRRLTDDQEARVLSWLEREPGEFGFVTRRWTAPRLAAVIDREFGVRFNHRYVNDWLARRRVTPQVPARSARERDPALVDWWLRREWPRIKKRPSRTGRRSFSPTRAGS